VALRKNEESLCRRGPLPAGIIFPFPLKPKLVGQFEFVEWTGENHLRHSKFMGLREDKKARQPVVV
jgi:bifunctional non-homologous end joining protein LigD